MNCWLLLNETWRLAACHSHAASHQAGLQGLVWQEDLLYIAQRKNDGALTRHLRKPSLLQDFILFNRDKWHLIKLQKMQAQTLLSGLCRLLRWGHQSHVWSCMETKIVTTALKYAVSDKIAQCSSSVKTRKKTSLFLNLPKGMGARVRWAEDSMFIYSLPNRYSPLIIWGCKQSCRQAIPQSKAGLGKEKAPFFVKSHFQAQEITF